jgi:hypothetical protein
MQFLQTVNSRYTLRLKGFHHLPIFHFFQVVLLIFSSFSQIANVFPEIFFQETCYLILYFRTTFFFIELFHSLKLICIDQNVFKVIEFSLFFEDWLVFNQCYYTCFKLLDGLQDVNNIEIATDFLVT